MKKLLIALLFGLGFPLLALGAVNLPSTVNIGDLLRGGTAGNLIRIATSTKGSVLWIDSNGLPNWTATSTLGISAGGGSGTVTSVDMSVPTGLAISGNPITTSGTLALSLQAGYNIPLTASTTNWNGFYDTPSTRITAGSYLAWSGNTLSATYGTSTNNTWSGLQTFTNTGTTTFGGSIDIPHAYFVTTHGLRGDASDGLYMVANNGTAVANFGVGNTSNAIFSGAVNIDGNTRLATSLSGLAQLTSGAVSAITGTQGQFPYYSGTNTVSATSSIFLSATGNVGIGTTSPSQLLTVGNNNQFTVSSLGAIQGNSIVVANASTTNLSVATNLYASNVANCTNGVITGTGGLIACNASAFLTSASAGALYPTFAYASSSYATMWNLQAGSNITITTSTPGQVTISSTSSGNAAWTIGNGLIYNATSTDLVGIGTITPTTTLTVQGKGGTNPFQISSSTGSALLTVNQAGQILLPTGSASVPSYSFIGGTNSGMWLNSNTITFQSNGSTSLSISDTAVISNTKLGAGTGSVGSPAVYSGETTTGMYRPAASTLAFSAGGIEALRMTTTGIGINSTTPIVTLAVKATSTASTADIFDVATSSGGSYLRVTSTGRIGIGTTSPLAKLEVYGTAGNNNIVNFASSSNISQFLIAPNGSTTIASLGTGFVKSASGSLYTDTASYLSTTGIATGTAGNNFNISTTTSNLTINCPNASASNRGCLTSNDWSTFNGKQAALSGGTNGFVTIWTSSSALGVGKLIDNGTVVGLNATSSTVTFNVQGSGTLDLFNVASSSTTSIFNIKSNLRIGISSTTPTAMFVVQGTNSGGNTTTPIFAVASSTGAQYLSVSSFGTTTIVGSLIIPAATASVLSASGQIAINTTANTLSFNSGGTQFYLNPEKLLYAFDIEYSSTLSNNEDLPMFTTKSTSTITTIYCVNYGGTNDNMPVNLIWDTSVRTSTSTVASRAFTSYQSCNGTTTPTTLTPNGSTTVPSIRTVRLNTGIASSTKFHISIYGKENQ